MDCIVLGTILHFETDGVCNMLEEVLYCELRL